MASRYAVKARGCTSSRENAYRDVSTALYTVDASMSLWSEESEVSKFNRLEPRVPFTLSEDLAKVMIEAFDVHAKTRGRFDPGLGQVIEVWGLGAKERGPPSLLELRQARANSGRDALALEGGTLRKLRPVALDVTSIADGYAVDRAAERMRSNCEEFIVEAGGEVSARGKWPLEIRHPSNPQASLASLYLENSTASTSGLSAKRTMDGKRISHIIDPGTGQPGGFAVSVTVFGPKCVTADGLSTALVLTPESELDETMIRFPGYSALVVFEERETFRIRSVGSVPDFTCTHPVEPERLHLPGNRKDDRKLQACR
ncbi:MAG: FAD:protein FMN transferase [Leptospirales bacterium]|nr:FAD:protein FMN transferase [Leptospirales bacterium]